MPDPQRPDRLQQLADPAQASVFDSFSTQLQRKIAQAMTSGALASSAMGATPAIAMVPREAVEQLVPRLLDTWSKNYGSLGQMVPDNVVAAVRVLARRFPRTASHIQSVEPLALEPGIAGRLEPITTEWNGRVGRILVDPNQSYDDLLNTLTHELTHGGQAIRSASWADEFADMYSAASRQTGYFNNPFEVEARTAQVNQALKRTPGAFPSPGARLKAAREKAVDPLRWIK